MLMILEIVNRKVKCFIGIHSWVLSNSGPYSNGIGYIEYCTQCKTEKFK